MPRVEVPDDGENHNLATLLDTQSPVTGWVQGLTYQADSDNGDVLKIGSSSMDADDYDFELSAGDSVEDSSSEGRVMLNTRYVRNDGADPQHLIIRFEMT